MSIHEMQLEFTTIRAAEVSHVCDLATVREHLLKERDVRHRLQIDNATQKQQLADHLAQYQEGDRRRWSLIDLPIRAVLSLASGLIVTLVQK